MDRSDVVTDFEEMSGEAMTEGMARSIFGDSGGSDRDVDRSLNQGFIKVVAPLSLVLSIDPSSLLGKDPLPRPFNRRVGVFLVQGTGQGDSPPSLREVALVQRPDRLKMAGQLDLEALGKDRAAILAPLSLADQNLAAFEVQILNSKGKTLTESEAGAVKKCGDSVVDT